jgi:acetoin utilization protein AcuC
MMAKEPAEVVFLSSAELWQRGHGPSHPLKPQRLQRTHELLEEYGAFEAPNVRLVAPSPAAESELNFFHTREYVDGVRRLSAGDLTLHGRRYGFGPGDNPVFEGMYESEGLKAGSTLQGARMLVAGECDVAFSYSGGLHHGGPALASGFCVFNDIAVAIQWLLLQGLRVAYVDIDVHHGDGVQDAFYHSDQVLTISLHQDGRTLFPGTGFVNEVGSGAGQGFSVNVPLPPFTDDTHYLWAFNEIVPPLLARFDADILVTQLGVDTHHRDPLAQMVLTTRGHKALFDALKDLAPVWLALGGGGYDISVVPRSWTLALETMSGQPFPDALPPRYQKKYGGDRLRDEEVVMLPQETKNRMRKQVELVVAGVKRQHGI